MPTVRSSTTQSAQPSSRSPEWPGPFAAVPQDTAALKETVVGIDAFENVRPHWDGVAGPGRAGAMRCDVASSMRHATWHTTAAADGALRRAVRRDVMLPFGVMSCGRSA